MLMPPPAGGPTEPKCYGSPAKPLMKREVTRVSEHSTYERLLQDAADESCQFVSEEEEEEDEFLNSTRKSAYMTDEVEQKLQLGGVDPYGLLELEDKRWRATTDEIRRSYRRLVLQHHPDKKMSATATMATDGKTGLSEAAGEDIPEEDADFKLLSAAWDLLGSADRRRAFDSLDYFNDDLPQTFRKGKNFYRTFGPPFARQAKFSEVSNVPSLGNDNSPHQEVAAFYRFWQNLSSWRDFSLLTESDSSSRLTLDFLTKATPQRDLPFQTGTT